VVKKDFRRSGSDETFRRARGPQDIARQATSTDRSRRRRVTRVVNERQI